MKKSLFVAAFAALALVACKKTETVDNASETDTVEVITEDTVNVVTQDTVDVVTETTTTVDTLSK